MPRTRAEIGAVGLPLFSGSLSLEPNTTLRGARAAQTYRRMLYEEPAATAFFHACLTLLRTDVRVEPAGDTDADRRAAEHVEMSLHGMRHGLPVYLRQMFGFVWAGWDVHEIVYRRTPQGRIAWSHWGLRRQESLHRWQTKGRTDEVTAFEQRPAPAYDLRVIPLRKALHLVADDSEGSPEGRSAFRGMYRPWFMARNLELLLGISMERFGTGLPVFEVEPGAPRLSDTDQAALQAAVESLRQNEEAGLILPPGVRFRFAASPGLAASDYLAVIQYLRIVMLQTVMAEFIALGVNGSGSRALGESKIDLFLASLNAYQDRIADAIGAQAVRRLLAFAANDFGALTGLPRVKLPPVQTYDLQKIGSFVTLLNKVGAFHPTPEDEALFRRIADLVDLPLERLEEMHEDAAPSVPPVAAAAEADNDDATAMDAAGDDETAVVEDEDEPEEEPATV